MRSWKVCVRSLSAGSFDGHGGKMIRDKDGYGRVISEYYRGQEAPEIIERDDGWFDVSSGGPAYFAAERQ